MGVIQSGVSAISHKWMPTIGRTEEMLVVALFQEFLCDLRELLTNVAGQPVMDAAGMYAGHVGDNYRRRRGDRNDQPDDDKEQAPGKRNQLQDLGTTAMVALNEMLLVVAAHLRRDAGNVEPPPGQNIPDHLICTNTH